MSIDPSYLYSTRIEKTFDEDNAEIIHRLKAELAKNEKLSVRLINYYKGLPVSYPAAVVGVERDIVDIDVIPQQAFSMLEHRYTFIRCGIFRRDIHANVQYVNIKRSAISLRKLCYIEIMAERRNYIRLELEKHPNALLITKNGVVKGKVTELAINGACIRVEQSCSLEIGDELTIGFMLHDHQQNVDYSVKTLARLVGIEGNSQQRHYRFHTSPDRILDRILAQFLFQRQIEIMREIKDATDNCLNMQKSHW